MLCSYSVASLLDIYVTYNATRHKCVVNTYDTVIVVTPRRLFCKLSTTSCSLPNHHSLCLSRFVSLVVEIKMEAKKGNASSPHKYHPFLLIASEVGGLVKGVGGE